MHSIRKLATIVAAVTGATAAPSDAAPKHQTHRTHFVARDVSFTSYHPPTRYETFGKGVEHPLTKRAGTSSGDAAMSFLQSKLGLDTTDAKVKSGFTGEAATHVYVKQTLNGIEVANGVASVALKDNKVVAYGSNMVKPKSVASTKPKITEAQAISAAESNLGAKYNNWPTKLEYVLQENGQAVLTYVVQVQNQDHWYEAFVDAATGKVVNVIDFVAEASYRVVPFRAQDPTWSGFTLINNPADLSASPNGWHQDTQPYYTTRGNNVNAYHGDASTGQSTQTSNPLNFDFLWFPNDDPTTPENLDVARVNAFYVGNMYHDLLYKYGFTETAFNFQNTNFGNGGAENDAVEMIVQANGLNNANFATPPDGQPGVCRMFIWDKTNPRRDGDLVNGMITHEFTHGLSNRLTGGGTSRCLTTTESRGMGEGWSDTMAFWVEITGTTPTDFTMGSWVSGNPGGLRLYPYSTNKQVNPLMYSSANGITERGWITASSLGKSLITTLVAHKLGTIWGTMLVEVYWNMVAAHGYSDNKNAPNQSTGNIMFLHLFVDALSLQPCNPTFLDARDAIVQADVNRYSGLNKCAIWRGFAKRGLGVQAANMVDDNHVPVGCGN
ncbi:hypothetical protein FRB99_004833 [Tulasnella sp. 403]|nr:hypothetical protein FRB99_004833 [Tulasnella sp. 403]